VAAGPQRSDCEWRNPFRQSLNQLLIAKVTGNHGVLCIGKFALGKKPFDFALNTSIIQPESEISSSMDFVSL